MNYFDENYLIYFDENFQFSQHNTLFLKDAQGVCRERKCQICGVRQQNGLGPCLEDSGIGQERVCVFPGHLERTHFANWSSGNYFEDPALVWWAIFFALVVVWIVLNCGVFGASVSALIVQRNYYRIRSALSPNDADVSQEGDTTEEIEREEE